MELLTETYKKEISFELSTWYPFHLQVYLNGHNLLAAELKQEGIHYTMIDNAFDSIEYPQKAQNADQSLLTYKHIDFSPR